MRCSRVLAAPTTRVFLLPAALYLTRLSETSNLPRLSNETHTGELEDYFSSSQPGRKAGLLETVLLQAWGEYNPELAAARPAASAFVQLAAALSDASVNGRCRMLLHMPQAWRAFVPWATVCLVVVLASVWLLFQPMEMRATLMSG